MGGPQRIVRGFAVTCGVGPAPVFVEGRTGAVSLQPTNGSLAQPIVFWKLWDGRNPAESRSNSGSPLAARGGPSRLGKVCLTAVGQSLLPFAPRLTALFCCLSVTVLACRAAIVADGRKGPSKVQTRPSQATLPTGTPASQVFWEWPTHTPRSLSPTVYTRSVLRAPAANVYRCEEDALRIERGYPEASFVLILK